MRHLAKTLVGCGVDQGLADAIQETLKKEKADRGTFDTLVESQVEEELKKATEAASAVLATSEGDKASLANAMEAADAALQAAVAQKEASATALVEAVAGRKAAATTLIEATKSESSLESEVSKAVKALEAAKKDAVAFQEGALSCFAELKVLEPPPPPPVVEEPAPMEEAAKAAEEVSAAAP